MPLAPAQLETLLRHMLDPAQTIPGIAQAAGMTLVDLADAFGDPALQSRIDALVALGHARDRLFAAAAAPVVAEAMGLTIAAYSDAERAGPPAPDPKSRHERRLLADGARKAATILCRLGAPPPPARAPRSRPEKPAPASNARNPADPAGPSVQLNMPELPSDHRRTSALPQDSLRTPPSPVPNPTTIPPRSAAPCPNFSPDSAPP